jgi:hypothetical protein
MKTPSLICLSLVGCSTVFLTNCADTVVNKTEQNLSGYALGVAKGQHDGKTGLSKQPDRWSANYSEADRAEYMRGYEAGYTQGVNGPKLPHREEDNTFKNTLAARPNRGSVDVFDGSQKISTCRTANSKIDDYRFIHAQNHLLVKSDDSNGVGKVELFDTTTGQKLESIDSASVTEEGPLWAVGMSDA